MKIMSEQSFGKIYFLYDFIEKYIFREYKLEIDLIKDNLSFKENKDVIDIGGGTGYIAKSIINQVNSVSIIDFSKEMLMQLKNPIIKPIQGNASSLPIKECVFDIALLINVLHHIEKFEQNNVISETYRILKKNGEIFIIDLFYPNKFLNRIFNKFEEFVAGKTYHITHYEIEQKLKNAGFQNISSTFQDWRNYKYLIIAKK